MRIPNNININEYIEYDEAKFKLYFKSDKLILDALECVKKENKAYDVVEVMYYD
jgi:hypothetical protein